MEIVYVFDKNYIPYFEMSVQSVLKFNPHANITVVSPEKLDIPYKNVVIPIGKQKHRENDRITDATYLKLMLPKLPLDKIIYMDADILCLGSLKELWKKDCDFINLCESHIGGEKQAKAHGHEKYSLSGVMVMNLQALRDFNFIEKAFKPFEIDLPLWCHEESIINHYFYDKLTFIDRKYNYCYNRVYKEPLEEDKIVLLHFPAFEKRYMRLEYANKLLFLPYLIGL